MKYIVSSIFLFTLFVITPHTIFAQDTIHVDAGWNMIGAKSTMLQSGFTSEPAGIITSQYYGYKSGVGYSSRDTLKKGFGYWVKSSQAGIIIAASVNLSPNIPFNPIPADNDTGVNKTQSLNWSCSDSDNDPITYDVYFGTDNPPVTQVSTGQTGTNLSRSGLSDSATYYWKVVAKDNHGGFATSPVWKYTTAWVFLCSNQISYSGKTYNTVQIGSQCWFAQNLDIGTMIATTLDQTSNGTTEKYCYNNDTANCTLYGGFYKWLEAMQFNTTEGAQGICPTGWHIPTNGEMQTLGTTVGNDGNALKAVGQGTGGGVGTNTSGFSALPSGYRNFNQLFSNVGLVTYFWSSTESSAPNHAGTVGLWYDDSGIFFDDYGPAFGFSVRCLEN